LTGNDSAIKENLAPISFNDKDATMITRDDNEKHPLYYILCKIILNHVVIQLSRFSLAFETGKQNCETVNVRCLKKKKSAFKFVGRLCEGLVKAA